MLFNSLAFAVFLPIVFGIYWGIANHSLRLRNAFLLLSSYLFYGWWDWRFLGLIILSSLTDYVVGLGLEKTENPGKRKSLLLLSLGVNLGVLGAFKYFDFFLDSFVSLFQTFGMDLQGPSLGIILPVGISFYTFQTLSYTIDVYRRQMKPTRDSLAFFSYVAFFPQLVAGPIERASHLLPQFAIRRTFDPGQAVSGLRLMLWGLFKKVVIADGLASMVDLVYGQGDQFGPLAILLATFFFAIQIYADFSGYSDIAIGCARLFGFDIMTNFRTPYFSTSLREFWQRWHISLSTWFRDYVYIPLGGNRSQASRWFFNILLTFVLSGLWNGANATFLAWGLIHGLALGIESLWRKNKLIQMEAPSFLKGIFTFMIVLLAWVFFRAQSWGDAMIIFGQIGHWEMAFDGLSHMLPAHNERWFLASSLLIFLIIEIGISKKDFHLWLASMSSWQRWGLYYLLVLWILFFGEFDAAPSFIYFQF